ncbi:MAG: hypothetical protein C0483_23110 [Pirellula sp.]|nr:hypothetical protein [Pirellula sp.]
MVVGAVPYGAVPYGAVPYGAVPYGEAPYGVAATAALADGDAAAMFGDAYRSLVGMAAEGVAGELISRNGFAPATAAGGIAGDAEVGIGLDIGAEAGTDVGVE